MSGWRSIDGGIARARTTWNWPQIPSQGWSWHMGRTCGGPFHSDFNYDIDASITEKQQPEVAKQVLPMFANDGAIAKMADSCGIDLEEYVTTEAPGMSAFALEDGSIYQTYSSLQVGFPVFYYQVLERAPKGGKQGVPVLRHDEYPEIFAAGASG